ncbi:MAG: hypothetical protein ACJ8IK_06065 [Burkholderiaceae bacterium]
MTRLPALPRCPRATHARVRAGAAGLAVVLLLSLAACKGDDSGPLTPAGAALVASAPAVAAARVPQPPVIQSLSTDTPAAPAAGDLASVESQLDTTLTKASACSADTECRTVAVGAKACGGPTGYRAYSGKTVSPDSVEALAQHERELAAAQARASHQVSPCFMLADPGARCVQNKCVTGRAAP